MINIFNTANNKKQCNEDIKTFSKEIVEEIKPDELFLYEVTVEEYFKNPKIFSNPKKLKKQELGGGIIVDGVTALTPFILIGANAVYNFLKPQIIEYFNNKAENIVKKELDNIFKLIRNKKDKPINISSEDLIEVHNIISKELSIYELSDKDIRLISDAIVGKISIYKKS